MWLFSTLYLFHNPVFSCFFQILQTSEITHDTLCEPLISGMFLPSFFGMVFVGGSNGPTTYVSYCFLEGFPVTFPSHKLCLPNGLWEVCFFAGCSRHGESHQRYDPIVAWSLGEGAGRRDWAADEDIPTILIEPWRECPQGCPKKHTEIQEFVVFYWSWICRRWFFTDYYIWFFTNLVGISCGWKIFWILILGCQHVVRKKIMTKLTPKLNKTGKKIRQRLHHKSLMHKNTPQRHGTGVFVAQRFSRCFFCDQQRQKKLL